MTVHPLANQIVGDLLPTPRQSGDVGVELEIEGENLPLAATGFTVKPENSLRGSKGRVIRPEDGDCADMPREYVTSGAMTLCTLYTRLQGLAAAFKEPRVSVNLTPRASTHIHVNMQRGTLRAAFGFILLFTICEPLLLRICGRHRNGNLFCLPNYETGDAASHFQRVIDDTLQFGSVQWLDRGKYASLNTDPLRRFGSFEVRCFPNSIDPEEITRWAEWLVNIRTITREWEEPTYCELIESAYWQPNSMAAQVFTKHPNLERAGDGNNLSELIQAGAENAYELYRVFLPFLDWQEKVKKSKGRIKKRFAVDDFYGEDMPLTTLDMEPEE